MTLGELTDLLKAQDQEALLYIDGPIRLTPGALMSYRGYYEQLAIGVAADGDPGTVGDFVKKLEAANGASFEGYKGGDFTMSRDTRVWFSNYGECGDCGPSGVAVDGRTVSLTYAEVE